MRCLLHLWGKFKGRHSLKPKCNTCDCKVLAWQKIYAHLTIQERAVAMIMGEDQCSMRSIATLSICTHAAGRSTLATPCWPNRKRAKRQRERRPAHAGCLSRRAAGQATAGRVPAINHQVAVDLRPSRRSRGRIARLIRAASGARN